MTDPLNDQHWHALLEAAAEDSLSADEHQQLADRLRDDDVALAQYVAHLGLHGQLEWLHADALIQSPDVSEFEVTVQPAAPDNRGSDSYAAFRRKRSLTDAIHWQQHRFRFSTFSAVLTAIAWAGFIFVMGLSTTPDDSRPNRSGNIQYVAEITGQYEPRWAEGMRSFSSHAALLSGERLSLAEGLVEITFDEGAVVILEAPVEFVIDSPGAGTLEVGKLIARANEGFLIATPNANFIDLGTAFGASVDEYGVAELHVFEGKVRAEVLDATGKVLRAVTLVEDEAVQIDPRQTQIVTLMAQPDHFEHTVSVASVPRYANGTILDLSGATAVADSDNSGAFPASNAFDNNNSTRWVSDTGSGNPPPHWIYVDMGSDLKLNEVQIDWRNDTGYTPDDFEILMRTEAQGANSSPVTWTQVASLTGGALDTTVQIDHFFDFATNTFTAAGPPGIGGTGVFSGGTGPVGRYLMVHITAVPDGGQLGAAMWELNVDAEVATPEVPESPSVPDRVTDE